MEDKEKNIIKKPLQMKHKWQMTRKTTFAQYLATKWRENKNL